MSEARIYELPPRYETEEKAPPILNKYDQAQEALKQAEINKANARPIKPSRITLLHILCVLFIFFFAAVFMTHVFILAESEPAKEPVQKNITINIGTKE